MKIYNTEDNKVTKFIHEDGSETAIKDVETREIPQETKKYSVFISSSVGCPMSCSFCHLTIKRCPYSKLTTNQVISNLKEAISYRLKHTPELAGSYIKLSWMGMGDALLNPKMVSRVTIEIMNWVMENNYAKGLDGVDLSTVFPKINTDWIGEFNQLNEDLEEFPFNPNHPEALRSPFRFFYSLHSLLDTEKLMPNIENPFKVLDMLTNPYIKFNVLYHRIFIEGENDSQTEVNLLRDMMKTRFGRRELRILRYNSCEKSPYKESSRIESIVRNLSMNHNRIKIQDSPGSEVKAACGQFIVDMVGYEY